MIGNDQQRRLMMAISPRITTAAAASEKGVSRNAIHKAIDTGKINSEFFGRSIAILDDKKFRTWTPNPKRVAAHRVT